MKVTPAAGGKFFSIGTAALRVGAMVGQFRRTAERLKLNPALELDGVAYFSPDQVDAVEQDMLDDANAKPSATRPTRR